MAESLKVKPGPAPHLADKDRKPREPRRPDSPRDAAIKRQIAAATKAAKAGPGGAPGASPTPAKQPGKFKQWAESHKAELGIGIAASLIAAYIFAKLNGSTGILSGNSNPSNPNPGGGGTVPTSTGGGSGGGSGGGGGGGKGGGGGGKGGTTSYKKPSGGQGSGGKSPAKSASYYDRPVNKSGIPSLGSSPGAINPNVAHDTIPRGHSRQNVNPNLAPQIRQQTNYGSGRAQPTVGSMSAAQSLNAAFAAYRRSHPGATSAQFAAALSEAARAKRNASVTRGAGRRNVTYTAYRTRITSASQVRPTSAYRKAHGSHTSYSPGIRALRG